jgi:hypothetical protein
MKTQIKRVMLYCVLLLLFVAFEAQATSITFDATITADNHYAIYTGSKSSITTYWGMNELGGMGSPGLYNWSFPETWEDIVLDLGDYLYVVAWSDDNIAQGWIGEFVSNSRAILSNTVDWEVYLSGIDLDDWAEAPKEADLTAEITGAIWSPVAYYLNQPALPWSYWIQIENPGSNGYMKDISQKADWIWGSSMEPGSYLGEYQVFRTRVSPVPEPATIILFGSGILGAAIFRRKRVK